MVGGWSTRKDGMGSALSGIRAVEGSGDGATRISIELFPGGWAGIAKEFSPMAGGGGLKKKPGPTAHGRSDGHRGLDGGRKWDRTPPLLGGMELGSTGWCRQEARYQDFDGVCKEGSGRSVLRGGECHEAPLRRLRRRQEWGFIGLDRHRRPGGLQPSRRLIRGLRRRVGSKRRGGRGSVCSWAGPGGNLLCQDLLISFSHAPPGPTSPRGPPRT